MNRPKTLSNHIEDVIIISGRADAHYWCKQFSISPFTLFHLLKTVGNRVSQLEEFLHNHREVKLENEPKSIKSPKNFTVL